MIISFSESTGVMESNEVELLAIRKAIYLWSRFGNGNLIVEGYSVNLIAWASDRKKKKNPCGGWLTL